MLVSQPVTWREAGAWGIVSVSMTGRTVDKGHRVGRVSSTGGLTASGLEPGGGTFGQRSNGCRVIIYTAGSRSVTAGQPKDYFSASNRP